ncbi:ATP-binding protein [Pedobacter sp. V48]|uniref:ATP-binding protein n=1 Tax=Pedobacter sp. V48 TaxID=509635 RepID=UPI0003E58ADA|nr:AAA family ATPase [Pedobacter sp. V48]ETZ24277.1 ATPase AAA [Pedobacter sp. V48]
MEGLFEKSYQKLLRVPTQFKRYLATEIDWNNRLIGIKGARGAGKTTLMLQYAKLHLPQGKETLYISLDSLYFTDNRLIDLADQFVMQGGKFLLLDEVHRYANWSQEIKNIYDDQPDLKIIFTGSSIMHINKAKGDLSRRAIMYELAGLSFREFLNFTLGTAFNTISFNDLISNHTVMAMNIVENMHPYEHFGNYLKYGHYPYFLENINLYPQKLAETISLAISIDLPAFHDISFKSIEKIRLLLHIIAESVPFKPNISKLSERVDISRNNLVQFIKYLEDMRIIRGLYPNTKGIGLLQKPEKIYLHHPNLQYALANEQSNIGNMRESFFINQIAKLGSVTYTAEGDFAFKNHIFEIGGKNKTNKQVKHIENSFVAADEIEIGHNHKIPLWLFGFLY